MDYWQLIYNVYLQEYLYSCREPVELEDTFFCFTVAFESRFFLPESIILIVKANWQRHEHFKAPSQFDYIDDLTS